jgi:hypothetical protein
MFLSCKTGGQGSQPGDWRGLRLTVHGRFQNVLEEMQCGLTFCLAVLPSC